VVGIADTKDSELETSPGGLGVPTETIGSGLDSDPGTVDEVADFELLPACGAATEMEILLMPRMAAARLLVVPEVLLSLARDFDVGCDFVISQSLDNDRENMETVNVLMQ